jgi:lysophospholipase L1-like esterase
MIGTNNGAHKAEDVAGGITEIVTELRKQRPHCKILLLGVFPRGEKADTPARNKIKQINAIIAKLDDGKNVRYLDISAKLTNPDGSIPAEIMSDKVHLVTKGFQIWAESLQPFLDEVIKKNP